MKRLIEQYFLNWKNDPDKKPLVVYGARQVGKTYSIVEFGKDYYDSMIYFNFEGNHAIKQIFEKDLNPKRIIEDIEVYLNRKIQKNKTLLVFDEIQESERALTSLKYFYEQCPEYHIIAAGSMLGLALNRGEFSFPVGKVNLVTMYALNFEEFLMAFDKQNLIDLIYKSFKDNKPIESYIHEEILEYYYKYLVIGGMPAPLDAYIHHDDLDYVRISQNEIIRNYDGDMIKYTDVKESNKIIATYQSIPSQLSKENRKFQYKLIGSGARASSYEGCIEWLKTAGLINKCNKTKEGLIPLKIHEDLLSYKIYMNDIGLFLNTLNINLHNIKSDMISSNAKGAIAETYVMQQLVFNGLEPFYWESNGKAEIDFVVQTKDSVIPIECKYATNVQSKSLGIYTSKYKPPYSIRVSTKNFGFEKNIKSVPLYALFCFKGD